MTPLATYLRAATPDERSRTASLAGTTVAYLYQLAGCHRTRPAALLALSLERATHDVAADSAGRLAGITAMRLSTMCVARDFTDEPDAEAQ